MRANDLAGGLQEGVDFPIGSNGDAQEILRCRGFEPADQHAFLAPFLQPDFG
jgi:hypothetical protein